jgi:hypothetical protein
MVVMAVCLPDKGGWLMPAERADSAATSLAAQAPVRSRSLGWHRLRVAAARADRSRRRHKASERTGQTRAATTDRIIAVKAQSSSFRAPGQALRTAADL